MSECAIVCVFIQSVSQSVSQSVQTHTTCIYETWGERERERKRSERESWVEGRGSVTQGGGLPGSVTQHRVLLCCRSEGPGWFKESWDLNRKGTAPDKPQPENVNYHVLHRIYRTYNLFQAGIPCVCVGIGPKELMITFCPPDILV